MRLSIFSLISLLVFSISITVVSAHEHQNLSYLEVFQHKPHLNSIGFKDFRNVKSQVKTIGTILKANFAYSISDHRNPVILDGVILASAFDDEIHYLCHGQNHSYTILTKKNHLKLLNLAEAFAYLDDDSYLLKRLEPTWPDLMQLTRQKVKILRVPTKMHRKRYFEMYELKNLLLEYGRFG